MSGEAAPHDAGKRPAVSTRLNLRGAGLSAAMAAVLAVNVLVLTPLMLYAGNSNEFASAWPTLLKLYLPGLVLIPGLVGLLALMMPGAGANRVAGVLAALAVLAALSPLMRLETTSQSSAVGQAYGALTAVPYSEALLDQYRAQDRPVFATFTAAWCVTCQIDKLNVFSSQEVASAIERRDAIFMVGDWTVRDPEITNALGAFGASGVPFYVYYPPSGAPRPLAIPITKKAVLEVLAQ